MGSKGLSTWNNYLIMKTILLPFNLITDDEINFKSIPHGAFLPISSNLR